MKKEYLKRASTDLTDEQWTVIEPLFVGMRGDNYHMTFRNGKRSIVSFVEPIKKACGIKSWSI